MNLVKSLVGMDDEDIEEALAKMDGRREEPQTPQLGRTFRPPDRDFAERMFKMFARPFDPNWNMPDLDGPEYRQRQKQFTFPTWTRAGMRRSGRRGKRQTATASAM